MEQPLHKKAFILTHLGLGDNIFCSGIVRHIYPSYEETHVVVKVQNAETVGQLYSDLPNLKLYIVNNDREISPIYGCHFAKYKSITENFDVFSTGFHMLHKKADVHLFPLNFYDDLDIPRHYLWTKTIIPRIPAAVSLYELVQQKSYIFIHNNSSHGDIFTIEKVCAYFNIDKCQTLIINPLKNVYDVSDSYYELAQQFLHQPTILSYTYLLENSSMNILSDSSIFCLANLLHIKHSNNYLITRNFNFSHIYDSKTYLPEETTHIRNKFTEIILK